MSRTSWIVEVLVLDIRYMRIQRKPEISEGCNNHMSVYPEPKEGERRRVILILLKSWHKNFLFKNHLPL